VFRADDSAVPVFNNMELYCSNIGAQLSFLLFLFFMYAFLTDFERAKAIFVYHCSLLAAQ
jgi:hypothetical protein